MDIKNDLENINEINMECSCCDDDDDNVFNITEDVFKITGTLAANKDKEASNKAAEMPDYDKNTGVIIDLNDEEGTSTPERCVDCFEPFATQNVESSPTPSFPEATKTSNAPEVVEINHIDMECRYGEDSLEDSNIRDVDKKSLELKELPVAFDNAEDEIFTNELISEEMLEEKKQLDQGTVEDDYWAKMQKKHLKSNKKGAYNTHFHLSGNPKKDMELFNHDMQTGKIPNINTSNAVEAPIQATSVISNNITGTGAANVAGIASASSCSESLQESDKTALNEFLEVIGFEVISNHNGSYLIIDLLDDDRALECVDKEDLYNQLYPYVEDCFICPLQVATGKSFSGCADWIAWYDEEAQQKYPKCASDINYLKTFIKNFA